MNKFKKIMSAAIAAATLLAGTTFTASADYDSYDVNRDGRVSPADLVQLNKYLCGAYSYTNYNLCDVNKSLTADAADAECLKLRVLGNDYSSAYYSRKTGTTVAAPTVSGFTPSVSSSSSAGREYIKYDYKNHSTFNYTLTPTSFALPESSNPVAEPRDIIGNDDRYASTGSENNGIVYLETLKTTGFIVGDHQIATHPQSVYDNVENRWRSLTIKTYDENGCLDNNNTLTPVEAHIPKLFSSSSDSMYDYALITVEEDLSNYVHFALGTPYNVSKSAYSNIPVYVTGYPMDKFNTSGIRLFSAEGSVLDNTMNKVDIVCYDVDTKTNEMGAPVYTITKIGSQYVYTAIAINSSGYKTFGRNWGSMITNYHLQFYLNNPNAKYSAN